MASRMEDWPELAHAIAEAALNHCQMFHWAAPHAPSMDSWMSEKC